MLTDLSELKIKMIELSHGLGLSGQSQEAIQVAIDEVEGRFQATMKELKQSCGKIADDESGGSQTEVGEGDGKATKVKTESDLEEEDDAQYLELRAELEHLKVEQAVRDQHILEVEVVKRALAEQESRHLAEIQKLEAEKADLQRDVGYWLRKARGRDVSGKGHESWVG